MILINTEFPEHLHHTTNEIYSGMHFRRRSEIKRKFLWWMKTIKFPKEAQHLKDRHLHFAFEFKGRAYDCDNCSFMGKLIVDGMIVSKVFANDSPKYIKSVTYESVKGKENHLIVTAEDTLDACTILSWVDIPPGVI